MVAAPGAGVTAPLAAVHFLDRLHGWISYRDGVLKTTDGGVTWTRSAAGLAQISDLHFLSREIGWAVSSRRYPRDT